MADTLLADWETMPCPRCGGSGHHSYCQMWGTICFRCKGAKRVLTARGQAAMAWLTDQRKALVADLQPGMRVKLDGHRKPLVLEGAKPSLNSVQTPTGPLRYVDLVFAELVYSTSPDTLVEVVPASESERVAQVRAAIAYQNTLTKAGKPRKVKTARASQ